jgi:LuxR family transcriptional regulator, maltose regulon positive regulatory protein
METVLAADSQLIMTKLMVPPLTRRVLPRPRLSQLLVPNSQRKLTLVSAPAGFGKTMFLASWLHETGQNPVAWVTLDEHDNDPLQFWEYVFTACELCVPGLGAPCLTLLRMPQPPAMIHILTMLINALLQQETTFFLVLDDYHQINAPAIHSELAGLLEQAPTQLHVVLLTRSDPPLPLARLRAHGDVLELRGEVLRCTEDEARAFLCEIMGLALTADMLAEIAARTEGWLVGLQLFGLWLQGHANPAALLDELRGTQQHIHDYLSEQVLSQLTAPVQQFLMRSAVLERMCGPLCDAVVGHPRSQAMLEQLERANLFLVPLDSERRWYRFHHLLRDALYARLQRMYPDDIGQLHRQASHWYAAQGFSSEAIEHALKAENWRQAVVLPEPVCLEGGGDNNRPGTMLNHRFVEEAAPIPALPVRMRPSVPPATSDQPLIEPLSERELEVLTLVATGASNKAIAQRFALAANTVKRHVSNILGKLNTTNRTQAVARARSLGLLAD